MLKSPIFWCANGAVDPLVPAQAETQRWISAFAGMSGHHSSFPRRDWRASVVKQRCILLVTTGHSRSKNGVASLAYAPVVHAEVQRCQQSEFCSNRFAAWIAGSSPAMTK
jgi:hypothetical protein